MRYKPKNKKTTIIIIAAAIIAVIIFYALGFNTIRSATRIGYTGREWMDSWSGKYIRLNGTMIKIIHTDTTPDVIHVEITTESGSIAISMTDSDGNVVFEKDNIETSSFDVEVPNKVRVTIDADNHKGSFSITSK